MLIALTNGLTNKHKKSAHLHSNWAFVFFRKSWMSEFLFYTKSTQKVPNNEKVSQKVLFAQKVTFYELK